MIRLYFVCFLIFSLSINGQDRNVDSIQKDATPEKIDSAYIHFVLNKWVKNYLLHEFDQPGYNGLGIRQLPDSMLAQRIKKLDDNTPLDLRLTDEVRNIIRYYLGKNFDFIKNIKSRSEFYFPLFESILDQYGLPLELKYIPIIESALNPKAKSKAGATGLWQFMYATGKMQGLEISSYVDQRMDPSLSTDAACRYFKKLYDLFGDWELAIAAYNAGPGNVTKAIRNSGGKKNFWEIRHYLPRETANYIPSLISAIYVMNYSGTHGVVSTDQKINYFEVDTIKAEKGIHLLDIAYLLSIDSSIIKDLNPQYKHLYVPPPKNNIPYRFYIPINKMMKLSFVTDSLYKMASIRLQKTPLPPPWKLASGRVHIVRSGDTLGEIAEKYNLKIRDIKRWNNLRSTRIRIGQKLKI
jgi:membrane-bound lytic murein transglycosylase D